MSRYEDVDMSPGIIKADQEIAEGVILIAPNGYWAYTKDGWIKLKDDQEKKVEK